jgi:hypothetical protein
VFTFVYTKIKQRICFTESVGSLLLLPEHLNQYNLSYSYWNKKHKPALLPVLTHMHLKIEGEERERERETYIWKARFIWFLPKDYSLDPISCRFSHCRKPRSCKVKLVSEALHKITELNSYISTTSKMKQIKNCAKEKTFLQQYDISQLQALSNTLLQQST